MDDSTVGELVRTLEHEYIYGTTQFSKYVSGSQYENLEKITAYANSKHVTGDTDAMGREKPFFNICTAAVNVWYRATDIDRKNIRIKPTTSSTVVAAFLGTIKLQDYMRRDYFGTFLNDWGRNLAKYGSVVCKFVEQGNELHSSVVKWGSLITDSISFEDNPVIEKLSLTPAQLKQNKGYDQEVVDELLDAVTSRKLLDGTQVDNILNSIDVYEVHGNLPLSFLTGEDKDDDIYTQQMHVVSFVGTGKGSDGKMQYNEFTLAKGKEKQSPYILTHLIKEDDRALGYGAIELLFEAQWMMNHTVKSIKDQLDLASKLVYQTADGSFVGRNVLEEIENGDILIYKDSPLTQVNNNSHDITSLQNFGNQWSVLGQTITSTPDAIRGNTQPSGTAYRLQQLITNESHSLFEQMIENKGLAIEEMMRRFIIPHVKKQLNSKEEINAVLSDAQIKQFDTMFIPNKAVKIVNEKVKKNILAGVTDGLTQEAQAQDIQSEIQSLQTEFAKLGNNRFVKPDELDEKTWKEVLDGLDWDVEVEVTNEQSDKEALLTTLTTVFQTLVNPNAQAILQTEQGKLVFNKILETAGGVSSIEMANVNNAPIQQQAPANATAVPTGGV